MAHAVRSTASIAGGIGARGEERETHMESVTYRDQVSQAEMSAWC